MRQDKTSEVTINDLESLYRTTVDHDAALEVSERNFEVEQSRFELGLADSQELLDAQTNLTQSRTDALNAVVSYQRAMQSLRQATMSSPHELVVSAAD